MHFANLVIVDCQLNLEFHRDKVPHPRAEVSCPAPSRLDVRSPRATLDVGGRYWRRDSADAATTGEAVSGSAALTSTQVAASQSTGSLVFVDPTVPEMQTLIEGIVGADEIVLLNRNESGIDQISRILQQRNNVGSVHIIAHGRAGGIDLGETVIDEASLVDSQDQLRQWRNALAADADILLYGCHVGDGDVGDQFVRRLANLTGADVAASVNATGSPMRSADWVLERTTGSIEASIVINTAMQQAYRGQLPISIRAAGTTNEEQMLLQIDGVTVATYNNIGGDADANVFQTYNYSGGAGVDPSRVRVVFTNDLFDGAAGIDRNLRVDNITLNGTTYETEAASVLSTGTWVDGDGVTPGFGRGEYLHSNGYFQYGSAAGTSIDIRARGETGQESMALQIDGVTVQTWDNVGTSNQTYSFQAAGTVDPSQIRVAFTNDLFDGVNNIDRNLVVDFIEVDGTTIETESNQVFSTGTWVSPEGVEPGFGRGDTLHSDGYFQYGSGGSGGSEIIIVAEGAEGDETIELQIDGVAVQEWQNIGTSSQAFIYNASSQVTADQVRVAFTNDAFNPAAGIDRDVLVDRIAIDNVQYESEDYYVFSTATYDDADGIVDGYGRGDTLHAEGYFQYASSPPADSGSFGLSGSVISVDESAGVAVATINRNNGSSTPASIRYETGDGSATAGSDYESRSGTIVFQPGQTSRSIEIPLIADNVGEGSENFSFTIFNPLGAGLLVPRTATVTINDLDLPNFDDFSNVSELNLNGTAARSGSVLRLTPATQTNVAGSAFYDNAIPIDSNTSFQSSFAFRISGGADGADGMAFVLQGSGAGANALGDTGGGLGLEGIGQSVAVEFDTYANPGDVNANHVSIVLNGNITSPIATKTFGTDLNNGQPKYAWVDYNGSNDKIAVYLSNTNAKPSTPLLTTTLNLQAVVGNNAYAGFTAGTGGLTNNHDVLNWTLNNDVPSIPDNPSGGTLVDQVVASGLVQPTSIDFSADGSNLYVAEQRGIVNVYRNGEDLGTLLDFRDRVNGTRDRGLLDIAIHPDLANNPYVYLLYTYDPPEVNNQTAGSLAGADGNGNRAGRLTRVTLDASTDYTSIVTGSEVVLVGGNSTWANFNGFANSTFDFNEDPAGILADGSNLQDFIATDSESHTVGSVEFGPDGALYVSIGDGTSYNQVDVRTLRVQDIDNLSGKILRIDPITGEGLSDNPFFDGDADANRSKVYQYGVRNPFRITVDDATGRVYVGDVGWTQWEEINYGAPGANFGWPFYEGASGSNARTNQYRNLPEAAAFYNDPSINVTPSVLALNHAADGINAIVLGDIYDGSQYPAEYQGDLFFNDLGQGIVRHASLDANGNITGVNTFTTGAQIVVQMVQGPDGFMYYVDLDDGEVGRWEFV